MILPPKSLSWIYQGYVELIRIELVEATISPVPLL